jgi:hypothetical protein
MAGDQDTILQDPDRNAGELTVMPAKSISERL